MGGVAFVRCGGSGFFRPGGTGSEVCAQLKDKLGGKEIAMDELQDWLVVALNEQNLTIPEALKHPRLQPAGPAAAANLTAQTLRQNRVCHRPFAALQAMSASDKSGQSQKPPDYDEKLTQAVEKFREKHKLPAYDAVLLLVELFRIHQHH